MTVLRSGDLALGTDCDNMVDESIRRTRESINELNVALHVTSQGIQCGNMSVAFLDSSVENQKEGCIKVNQIISLNTIFHEWHLVSFRVHISSTVISATG